MIKCRETQKIITVLKCFNAVYLFIILTMFGLIFFGFKKSPACPEINDVRHVVPTVRYIKDEMTGICFSILEHKRDNLKMNIYVNIIGCPQAFPEEERHNIHATYQQ